MRVRQLLLLFAFASILIACDTQEVRNTLRVHPKPKPRYRYGICIDTLKVELGEIERNQNLSQILTDIGVTQAQVLQTTQALNGIFKVNRFRAGNNFEVFFSKKGKQVPRFFIYFIDDIQYLVISYGAKVQAEVHKRPVVTIEKTGKGTISSSLWKCMTDNGLNPMLALKLSDVYAWTIDFFALQEGDEFKVVYDEEFVDSASVGIKDVKYAVFRHQGTDIWAIPFTQDSTFGFFDDRGESLRKAFLKAPLHFSRISSHFSSGRMHPVLRIVRPHFGVDYAAPAGTPVATIGDGTVLFKGWVGGGGNCVKIRHNSVYTTVYMHLRGYGAGLQVGKRVRQGEVIGYVGSTGLSTGPHLDFRVYKNGSPVNPLTIESPPVDPIKPVYKDAFNHLRDSLKAILEHY